MRGYRNRPSADLEALYACLIQAAQIVIELPEVDAFDINPLVLGPKGGIAVDARISLSRRAPAGVSRLAIRPYPRELEEKAQLKDLAVLLRPVRPEDAARYAELIARSGAEDVRMRFSTLVRRLPAKDLARYTQIDYDREMAFVAEGPDGKRDILGEARIFAYPDGETAEFAVLVRSDMQRRGLGRALLGKAIEYSRARGSAALIGQINADNEAMLSLAKACGMEVEFPPEASLAIAHLDLRPRSPEVRLF